MGRTQARLVWVVAVMTLLAGAAVVPAQADHAEPKTVTTRNFTYEPTPTAIDIGDHLRLTNADAVPHDVTARDTDDSGEPLFSSELVSGGGSAPVNGVEDLAPGSYSFYCTIHAQMAGTLAVGAAGPTVPGPPGLTIASVPTPTSITEFDGNLYVASYGASAVFELPILPGGVPGPATAYITGVSSPLGVTFDEDGTAFVSDSHPAATPGRTTAGRVWAVPPGGGDVAEVGEVVLDELPNGRHNTNGMTIADGRLYVTNGNSTDDGIAGGEPEEPLSGTLLSVPVSARGIVIGVNDATADLVVEARGMRNTYDVVLRPGTSEAWMAMNGPDEQDPWGEDLLLMANVAPPVEGAIHEPEDFGFPACLYAAGFDPGYRQNENPAVTQVCDGSQDLPQELMGLHTSANGLDFGPDTTGWDGDLFVALFGNFFGDEIVGHRIVRVPIDEAGASSPPEDFLILPAPLDLTFVGDVMYVADFAAGVIVVPAGVGTAPAATSSQLSNF
jgi:plastocyanin